MDHKQTEEIIKRLELGEPLTRICKDNHIPEISTVYRKIRGSERLQKKVRAARETGVFTLIDKLTEELDTPVDNQQMMWKREVFSYLKWLASKLGSDTFGDKTRQEIKQDSTLTISWGRPNEKNMVEAKKDYKQVEGQDSAILPGAS
jgi:hypothetical protein